MSTRTRSHPLCPQTVGATIGIFAAGVIVAWKGPTAAPLTPLTRAKQLISLLGPTGGAVGGLFGLTECLAEDFRGTKSPVNAGIGGCAAGTVMGLQRRSPQTAAMGCIAFGAGAAAADFYKLSAQTPFDRAPARSALDMDASAGALTRHIKSQKGV